MRKIIIDSKTRTREDELKALKYLSDTFPNAGYSVRRMATQESYSNLPLDMNNPQRWIQFPLPNNLRISGFFGFAVNMIWLSDGQLQRDLRRRLWYNFFWNTMVFERKGDVMEAQKIPALVQYKMISLDGYHYTGPKGNCN